MTPRRTHPGGPFRFDRSFPGVGNINRSSRTKSLKTFHRLNDLLTELWEDARVDVLRDIRSGRVTAQEVYDQRRKRKPYDGTSVILARRLEDEVARWVPRSAEAERSRKRYRVSWDHLLRLLPANVTAADLARVDWRSVRRRWKGGPADWNRMRSAVSRFLSMTLADKYHPHRRAVMAQLTRAKEPKGRLPDINAALFWRVVAAVPERVRACYVTMAALGVGPSEYLSLEEHHLLPHTRQVRVPGTKSEERDRLLVVGEEAWRWVNQGVPSPVRYKWLRIHFKRAAAACGSPGLRLYDLRHLRAMMLSDDGIPEAEIATVMGHTSVQTTRIYTRQKDRGRAAESTERRLFGEGA